MVISSQPHSLQGGPKARTSWVRVRPLGRSWDHHTLASERRDTGVAQRVYMGLSDTQPASTITTAPSTASAEATPTSFCVRAFAPPLHIRPRPCPAQCLCSTLLILGHAHIFLSQGLCTAIHSSCSQCSLPTPERLSAHSEPYETLELSDLPPWPTSHLSLTPCSVPSKLHNLPPAP